VKLQFDGDLPFQADKVRYGQRHFEAIGAPCAVVVSADEA